MNNADFSIEKNFPFKERYRVQFRWEMFNVFNRATFGVPDNTVTTAPLARSPILWGPAQELADPNSPRSAIRRE